MANINRFPKLIYFLFLVGLYLVRINANEEHNTMTTDSTSWSSDTMPIFGKFHLSFVRNMFDTLGSRSDADSDGPTAAQSRWLLQVKSKHSLLIFRIWVRFFKCINH